MMIARPVQDASHKVQEAGHATKEAAIDFKENVRRNRLHPFTLMRLLALRTHSTFAVADPEPASNLWIRCKAAIAHVSWTRPQAQAKMEKAKAEADQKARDAQAELEVRIACTARCSLVCRPALLHRWPSKSPGPAVSPLGLLCAEASDGGQGGDGGQRLPWPQEGEQH